jgi:hypothetical protein
LPLSDVGGASLANTVEPNYMVGPSTAKRYLDWASSQKSPSSVRRRCPSAPIRFCSPPPNTRRIRDAEIQFSLADA